MKKLLILLAFVALLCVSAQAGEMETHVLNNLTEVFGYSVEDADAFVHEDAGDGTQIWVHPDHPEWQYIAYPVEGGMANTESPFHTSGWLNHPGESVLRTLLYAARDGGWFAAWDAAARDGLQAMLENGSVTWTPYMAAVLQDASSTAAQAIDALFETCFGPAWGWPQVLTAWRDSVLAEYGLAAPERSLTVPGVTTVQDKNVQETTWYGTLPEELAAVFDRPELEGWTPLCGAYGAGGSYAFLPIEGTLTSDAKGLAVFEKEGRRLLVALLRVDGAWRIWPLGENLLYTGCDMAITHDASITFAITYMLSDHEIALFHVYPHIRLVAGQPTLACRLLCYERFDTAAGQQLRLTSAASDLGWRIAQGPIGGELSREDFAVRYPSYLGVTDIADFPTTAEQAHTVDALPAALRTGQLVIANEAHLRTKKSSRSTDLGMLCAGALLPVIGVEEGSEEPWIHTRLGALSGYVTSSYTSYNPYFAVDDPQPVARANREISLKKGTSLLDGTARTLPAGTRMHVVLVDGGWLYVAVPSGDIGWFMDVNSDYGYVRAGDVTIAGTAAQLDWEK